MALVISACNSSMNIDTQKKRPQYFFDGLQTYNWHPEADTFPSVGPQAKFHTQAKSLIESELTQKGFTLSSNPDFYVNYSIRKGGVVRISEYKTYAGYDPSFKWNKKEGMERPASREYNETAEEAVYVDAGMLVIDALHPKTDRLVWRASAKKKIDDYLTTLEAEKILKSAINKTMATFPSKK